ncbi:DNA-3-methyladenine glycosylase family protein [Lentibacter sp. XHP0401]|uniref:DNA-3-methyladenine glycosylase family protein n=1 Tax=Lentibacter sp. XHP0401 TaxID=2984334 RepID=UPI0021E7F272|nr:DNA-3-methyladenine glycosylase 2 family protein [Lentibacter sp. XHP0401]MCV2891746.1 DNA-3-methyladenine glycosylase 2 family protein [Lentibacter sp. XHP0401]
MDERVIVGPDCVAEGVAWLCAKDEKLAEAYQLTGPLPLRLKPEGFAELLSAIVSQQVSVASARAIWGRLVEAGCDRAESVEALSEEGLRALGLSRQKAVYAKALAEARIDYDALRDVPSDEVIRRLVAVKGIGTWTGEIYAMFSLGRADVFACGDLALQEAARVLYRLNERPKERMMREMAEMWAPWRAVAARLLWAYYKEIKHREGIL